MEFVTG